jgi:hypothetical protein
MAPLFLAPVGKEKGPFHHGFAESTPAKFKVLLASQVQGQPRQR